MFWVKPKRVHRKNRRATIYHIDATIGYSSMWYIRKEKKWVGGPYGGLYPFANKSASSGPRAKTMKEAKKIAHKALDAGASEVRLTKTVLRTTKKFPEGWEVSFIYKGAKCKSILSLEQMGASLQTSECSPASNAP